MNELLMPIGEIAINTLLLFSRFLQFLVIVRVLMSFFGGTQNSFGAFIHRLTEPLFAPLARLPLRYGMIDFSPLVLLLVLDLVQVGLRHLLLTYF